MLIKQDTSKGFPMKRVSLVSLVSLLLITSVLGASQEFESLDQNNQTIHELASKVSRYQHVTNTQKFEPIVSKYDQSHHIQVLDRWFNIIDTTTNDNLSYFINDSSRWINYSVMENLLFQIEDNQDLQSIKIQVYDILKFGSDYPSDLVPNDYTHVLKSDLNFRSLPIVKSMTVKKKLLKGGFVKVIYPISFTIDGILATWYFAENENAERGWINAAYTRELK